MPVKSSYRKKNYKNKRRRGGYKKRYHPKLRNVVPPGAAPLAAKHIVKMKFSETIFVAITSLEYFPITFRMNSTFGPSTLDPTVPHQPYGRDQLANLFGHYRVFRFKWHVSVGGTSDRVHTVCCPINGQPPALSTTFRTLSEYPRAVTKATSFNGGPPAIFKGSVSLPRLAGVTSTQYKTDDRYSAAMNANPNEAMTFLIAPYNPNGDALSTTITYTFFYYTEWYDPFTLAGS